MSTTWGTSYFVSVAAAERYYRDYFSGTRPALVKYVKGKIDAGEIHIGKPHVKDGDVLSVIDNGARYAITTQEGGR